MRIWRTASVAFLAAGLAACATAPAERRRPTFSAALRVCPTHGRNLPPAGPDHQILGYTGTAIVRGQEVARAPVEGCVSAGVGPRANGEGIHKGIDIVTRTPAPVHAAAEGTVAEARFRGAYGLTVLLSHRNGVATRYAHLSALAPGVEEGALVRAGAEIGMTGETGNAKGVHLHYEMRIDGEPVNPFTVGR